MKVHAGNLAFLLFGAGLLLLSACASSHVRQVDVRNTDFTLLRTIEGPTETAEFQSLWNAREKTSLGWAPEGFHAPEGYYLLDIDDSSGDHGGRWHYHPSGLMVLLTVKLSPVYRIPNAERFNQLLQIDKPAVSPEESFSLLRDPHFLNGFNIQDPTPGRAVVTGQLQPPGAEGEPHWALCQWTSQYDITGAAPEILADGAVRFANEAKAIILSGTGNNRELVLAIDTNLEYNGRFRQYGELWPHLLVQQNIDIHHFRDLARVSLHIEGRLDHNARTTGEAYTPTLHTAQFPLTFIVQDRNEASEGYGDFLWFNVLLYDERERFPEFYAMQDFADPSAKIIYAPATRVFADQSLHDGDWVTFSHDNLIPLFEEAIAHARANGFLATSPDDGDFAISSFILGWEVPGINKAAMRVRGLELRAVARE